MVDLVLDYNLLHELAASMQSLRGQIQTDVESVGGRAVVSSQGEVGSDAVGSATLFAALSAFYSTCHKPFKDSMDKLDELAKLLDSVAKAYFDLDSDIFTKVNEGRVQAQIAQWKSKEEAWKHYQETKDQVITYKYYDENGVLRTATIPLWGKDRPPPQDPGAAPTTLSGPGGTGTTTVTEVNGDGKVITETSNVTSPSGLSYSETTTYTYQDFNGDGTTDTVDYTTTVTHSDGSKEVITQTTNPDRTYVVTSTTDDGTTSTTVTPSDHGQYHSVTVDPEGNTTTTSVVLMPDGTGTKVVTGPKGTDTYTGDPERGLWTSTSHEDPPSDDPYTPINE